MASRNNEKKSWFGSFKESIKRYSADLLNRLARRANSRSLQAATLVGAGIAIGATTFNVIKSLNEDAEPEIGNWILVLTGASYLLSTCLTNLITILETYLEMQNKVRELKIDENVLPSRIVLVASEFLQAALALGGVSIYPWVQAGKDFDKKQSAPTAIQSICITSALLLRAIERFWYDNATKKTKHVIEQAEKERHARIYAKKYSRNQIIMMSAQISNFTAQYKEEESGLDERYKKAFKCGLIHHWVYFGLTFKEFIKLNQPYTI